jgi:lipid II:glycine glycyltransferase (peptidoglycan interpeptide bridge formation enzyme)
VTQAGEGVRELTGTELEGWDAAAVDAPGGHVYQSRAWAEHRAAGGWRPRFLAFGDTRALVLERPWPAIRGGSAYVPRGPVGPGIPWTVSDGGQPADPRAGATIGAALIAVAGHLEERGLDVVAADPEVAGDDAAYRDAIGDAGFRAIPEIQPSRHRMALPLPAGSDAEGVLSRVAKQTRQRIRRAERDGLVVVRRDARATPLEGTVEATGSEPADAAFRRFYDLLRDTGERRGFGFGGPSEFVPWWVRALAAGHLVHLEAREGDAGGEVLGALLVYRHGCRLSTVHSADRAERRHDHPGAMHLLRWRAIQLALAEGRTEMDLGGVDVADARRPPREGEPTYGLFEHKRSFGAHWVELGGAHERVIRPTRYALGRALSRAARAVGRG